MLCLNSLALAGQSPHLCLHCLTNSVPTPFTFSSEESEVLEDFIEYESESSDETEDEDEGQGILPETTVPGSNVARGPDVVGDEDFDMDKEAEEVRNLLLA
jgi:hypothetical protein